MGLFTCSCLNVKIHGRGSDLKAIDPLTLGNIDPSHEFFSHKISAVNLNIEGVIVEHWYLVKKKIMGDFSLHRCNNCDVWTHAVKKDEGSNLVYVSMGVVSNEADIAALYKHHKYSPMCKLILYHEKQEEPVPQLSVQAIHYESLQQTLASLEQQLNKYLKKEEITTENKIKEFEKQQRAAFADVERKARKDKNNLIHTIFNTVKKDLDELDFEVQKTKPFEKPIHPAFTAKAASLLSMKENQSNRAVVQSNIETELQKPVKKSEPFSKSASALSSQLHSRDNASALSAQLGASERKQRKIPKDEDEMFSMDQELEDELLPDSVDPFYEEEEENLEDDTDGNAEVDAQTALSAAMYSTSVPISVPTWNSSVSRVRDEDDEPTDPENIAASIKALAKSVHGDGKEIFGELPRRPRQRVYSTEYSGGGGGGNL